MMKKITLFVALMTATTSLMAQNKNVVSAIQYFGYYSKDKNADDLKEAKTYIDLAAENVETSQKAKTWINRGKIYFEIQVSRDEKVKALALNALEEAAKSFEKAYKLDIDKTYPESKQYLGNCAILYTQQGVNIFNAKDYAKALSYFENAIRINAENFKTLDTLSTFNAALAAERGGFNAKAIEYYKKLVDMKYGGEKEGALDYLSLARVYRNSGDSISEFAALKRGREAFPNDNTLIIEELNYNLAAGRDKEALADLNLAIAKDPKNSSLLFALGTLHDKQDNFAEAEAAYKKAIEVKPDYFDALYNLGALYFNKAVKMTDKANTITDNAKFAKEIAAADLVFKQALAPLEQADKVGSSDKGTIKSLLQTLQKLYLMTEQPDKAAAIKERIKN